MESTQSNKRGATIYFLIDFYLKARMAGQKCKNNITGRKSGGRDCLVSTKIEDDVISEVEDFGLKVRLFYSSILPSRSLPKVFEKFSGNLVA